MALQALGNAIRAWETDVFRIRTISSVSVVSIRADITLLFDDGSDGTITIFQATPSSTRTETITTSVPVPRDGWVTNLLVRTTREGLDRGQLYCRIQQAAVSGQERGLLASGYVYNSKNLTLGGYEGSLSGQGDRKPESIGTDIPGNGDTSHPLTLTDGIRRVDGLIFYYHSDGNAANRESVIRIRDLGGVVPAGFDAGNDRQISALAGPSLIADQDGIFFMNRFGYQASVDNATVTLANNSTAPNPFPFWVHEDDTGAEIVFDITAGLAGDNYGGFIFGESWFI